jgi:1,3-beta-glucan synthase
VASLLLCCCRCTCLPARRVLLPINFESVRGVVIGEGKPENQNHAVVFCPGEALQTIDCNQDNIVAESLKLRNLLAELLPEGWDEPHTSRQPTLTQTIQKGAQQLELWQVPEGKRRIALVGFREWIFSEDSGALAEFAAATERSFGTTVQRLMHNPGKAPFAAKLSSRIHPCLRP